MTHSFNFILIKKEFSKIQKELKELHKDNKALKEPMQITDTKQQEKEINKELNKAEENTSKENSPSQKKSQQKAAQKMQEMSEKMQEAMAASDSESSSETSSGGASRGMSLQQIFEGKTRAEMVGLFLAILTLVRDQRVAVSSTDDGVGLELKEGGEEHAAARGDADARFGPVFAHVAENET